MNFFVHLGGRNNNQNGLSGQYQRESEILENLSEGSLYKTNSLEHYLIEPTSHITAMVKPGTSGVQSANHLQFDDLHMAGCATSGMTCYDYGLTNHPTERRKTKHLTHLGLPINWQIFIPQ